MKFNEKMLLLYAVTDRAWVGKQALLEQIEDALKGGATIIQLRERIASSRKPFRFGICATNIMCR